MIHPLTKLPDLWIGVSGGHTLHILAVGRLTKSWITSIQTLDIVRYTDWGGGKIIQSSYRGADTVTHHIYIA